MEHVPRGPSLIIGPYNYSLKLAFEPLCAAIAAGCPSLLLLSEGSRKAGEVMKRIVESTLDSRIVRIEMGGKNEGVAATSKPWGRGTLGLCVGSRPRQADALLGLAVVFTGSTKVGREVAIACAKTLSPVTLEVGPG